MAEATFVDVVRVTWFAVDRHQDKIGAFEASMVQATPEIDIPTLPRVAHRGKRPL